ncbi:MAG TPA: hypothetical protein GXZ59_03745 [Clostridiaceae bacterium]|nr:hypothetical protein [Clostridiaceae bacterium]
MNKYKVLLIMSRKIVSDCLIAQADTSSSFKFQAEHDYAAAVQSAIKYDPAIVIVEVPESGIYRLTERCLQIADEIKKYLPRVKRLLLCSERDAESSRAAIRAKQEKRIDDFLFYDASVKFLFSKLEALI